MNRIFCAATFLFLVVGGIKSLYSTYSGPTYSCPIYIDQQLEPPSQPPFSKPGGSVRLETTVPKSPIKLAAKPSRVELSLLVESITSRAGVHVLAETSLISRATFPRKNDEHYYVVLNILRGVSEPGTVYEVYLDVPADELPDLAPDDPRHIGSVDFYKVLRQTSAGKNRRSSAVVSFDVTKKVNTVAAIKLLTPTNNGTSTITFVPVHAPANDAKPTIGSIDIVVQ